MGSFSIWHWLVVLAIVIIIFGTKKLRNVGGDLGGAIKNFKDAMKGEDEAAKKAEETKQLESSSTDAKTAKKQGSDKKA